MTTDNSFDIRIVPANQLQQEESDGPTAAERIRSRKVGFIDETIEPAKGHGAKDFPVQNVIFVKNYRGFKKGQRGARGHGAFKDGMVLHALPDFIPFDEVDDFCAELQRLKKAGLAQCAAAPANAKVSE